MFARTSKIFLDAVGAIRALHGWLSLLATLVLLSISPPAASYTIDTSSTSTSPMTGLWNNANEPGWGTAIIQQYGTMFVTMYTYDGSGNPVWYVASSCAVAGNGCTGSLYKVTGGSPPTVTWNGNNKAVTAVGTLTASFSDANTGTMAFTINGASGSKVITRNVFATAPAGGSPVAATCTASNFTLPKVDAIALGMTLDQVNQIIGCPNNPMYTQRSERYVAYAWANPSGSQSIVVFFDPTGTTVTAPTSQPGQPQFFKYSSGF